jgi:nucleotide-binding universal stress UspA family protein
VGRPATALIHEVLRSGHDLLVRAHARDLSAPGERPFGAVDMELLRTCPCPVLLVGPAAHAARPRIAVAVNASVEGPEERALNMKIVETGLLMAELENGVPTIVHAWAPFAEHMIRSHSSDAVFAEYVEAARQRAVTDLAQLVASLSDRHVRTALRRGEPEDVIPAYAVAEGVDLMVMGTVARGGIAGLLIGNTAERVLRKLPCSVLAVKPDGFECPVRLDGPY